MIDLQQAKFCVNCEAIYTEQVCPRCLSECFLWISSVVGTILKEKIEYGALQSGFFSSYFPRKPWRTWQGAFNLSQPRRPWDANRANASPGNADPIGAGRHLWRNLWAGRP